MSDIIPILQEIKVSYEPQVHSKHWFQIKSSQDAYKLIINHIVEWETIDYYESFWVILLNRSNRVKGFRRISYGGTTGTVVDSKIVFSVAVKCVACSIILCHNHPSGNTQPSQTDLDLTKKLQQAGVALDISVLDHLIISSNNCYYSMADMGDF